MMVPEFPDIPTTLYFREQVLRKRPYLKIAWCLQVLHHPYKRQMQEDGRIRFWGYVAELAGK